MVRDPLHGSYPCGLYRFAAGYLRWSFRVEPHALPMLDDHPPVSFDP
jgi:hypothetical protein